MTSSPRGSNLNDPNRPLLLELADRFEEPIVSLFTEWGRGGEARANELRARHCVSLAAERLQTWGASDRQRQAIEAAIDGRLGEIAMGASYDRLALFTDGAHTELWPLPGGPSELLHVSARPFVRPLLPAVQSDRPFLLLELALKDPKLYVCSRLTCEPAPTALPQSFEEVVGAEVESRGVQFRTQHALSSPDAHFHGHGGGHDDVVPELEQYLRELDRRLQSDWGSSGMPLVLAGVERERGHFRKVSDYRPIVERELPMMRESDQHGDLHQMALELFEERRRSDRLAELERLRGHLDGRGLLAGGGFASLLVQVYAGQVTHLYLLGDENVWGRFDPRTGELTSAAAHSGRDSEELLNLAALLTLEQRGLVFELSDQDLEEADLIGLWPRGEPAVGLLRGA